MADQSGTLKELRVKAMPQIPIHLRIYSFSPQMLALQKHHIPLEYRGILILFRLHFLDYYETYKQKNTENNNDHSSTNYSAFSNINVFVIFGANFFSFKKNIMDIVVTLLKPCPNPMPLTASQKVTVNLNLTFNISIY